MSVTNADQLRFYVRGQADAWLLEKKEQQWGDAVVTEPVCVSEMHSWLKQHPEAFIAAFA